MRITTQKNVHSGGLILKKFVAALLAVAIAFSPAGNFVFQDDVQTVEAKRYSSGKKSFNMNKSTPNSNHSYFQNKKAEEKNATVNKSSTTKSNQETSSKKGFLSGLMLGGLAGLMFGGLLAELGLLGSIFGLFINLLAIVALIAIIARIVAFFKDRKKKEAHSWRG